MQKILISLIILTLTVGCSSSNPDPYESLLQQKKATLLSQVADNYQPPSLNIGDPEKYVWPKVIARFELYGTHDSIANYYLEALKDRSPFHFTLVGMARIMSGYGDADFIRENKKHLLRVAFDRDDAENLWTSEGTENHVNMTRTSAYLFAQHALEFPGEFPDAREKMEMVKDWMKFWSKQIFTTGTGEWNSSIYLAYNVVAWLNVYDFAHDPEVKQIARAVLDSYATEMALHNSWGVTGGAEMRGVGANLNGRSSTAYYNWIWFSSNDKPLNGFQSSEYLQAVHAVTSTYRPHRVIRHFAAQKPSVPAYYTGGKPSYNFEEPSFVKQTFYKSANFSMGNKISNYGGFSGGNNQIVPWKIVLRDTLPKVISGNGMFYTDRTGRSRNPFTQTAQNENVILQLTKVPVEPGPYLAYVDSMIQWWGARSRDDLRKRFPSETYKLRHNFVNANKERNLKNQSFITLPRADLLESTPSGHVFRYGEVSVVIRSLHPLNDTIYHTDTRTFVDTSAPNGQLCGFVIEVLEGEARTSENHLSSSGNTVEFVSASGNHLKMTFTYAGQYIEPMYDWGFGPIKPVDRLTSPPFFQPLWESCDHCGRVPELWINHQLVDMKAQWPVYDGPGISWNNGVLKLHNEAGKLRIDYTGEIPEIKER
jgi:hypothetical protein